MPTWLDETGVVRGTTTITSNVTSTVRYVQPSRPTSSSGYGTSSTGSRIIWLGGHPERIFRRDLTSLPGSRSNEDMTTTPIPSNTASDGLPVGRPRFILGLRSTNTYAGPCRVCGQTVSAEAGHRARRSDGRWEVQHVEINACRIAWAAAVEAHAAAPAPTAARPDIERGQVWVQTVSAGTMGSVAVADETIRYYRVSARRHSGRLYLNYWNGYAWRYVGDIASIGRHSMREATAADAAAFGAAFSRCVFCGRDLDTAESITVGYGPTCAAQRGLPWGANAARSVDASFVTRATARAAAPSTIRPAARPRYVAENGCGCGEEFATAWEAEPANHDCHLALV